MYTNFQAEEGMMWEEWVHSRYNLDGYIMSDGKVMDTWSGNYVSLNDVKVGYNDFIYETTYGLVEETCCFISGTKITMSDGSIKNIEDVVPGDKVLSLNREKSAKYETIVTDLIIKSDTHKMAKVTLENGNSVTMNSYHPLLTVDGWKSLTNYNGYPTLTESDILITENGSSPIVSIDRWISKEPITTYTLNVADENENPDIDIDDNFFANGVCVHNVTPGACRPDV